MLKKSEQTFSPDHFENKFCHSEHFEENEKDINHLVKDLLNRVDGEE